MIRLTIFTAVRLFGEALAASLEQVDDLDVGTVVNDVTELADRVLDIAPDMVLFDVSSEQALDEGRALAETVPDIPILALALPEIPREVISCADAGFVGYVPREASVAELCRIIRMALRGELSCNPKIVGSLMREIHRRRHQIPDHDLSGPLTQRECEVVRLVGRGLSNKEIARELKLSVATVKNHLHSVFAKMRVKRRAEVLARLRSEPWLARSA